MPRTQRSFTCTGVKGCDVRFPKTSPPTISRSFRSGKARRDREDQASQTGWKPGSVWIDEDRFPELHSKGCRGEEEGQPFGGRRGLHAAATPDFPRTGAVVGAGQEPARLHAGDLLGDVEQRLEGGLDLEGRSEEVAAFQQGVDRSGKGKDLVGGNFEREVDGAARKL